MFENQFRKRGKKLKGSIHYKTDDRVVYMQRPFEPSVNLNEISTFYGGV